MARATKVFAAKTGTGASSAHGGGGNPTAFLVLTYGATPTITIALQGSNDNTNWETLVCHDDNVTAQTKAASFVYTAGSPQAFLASNPSIYLFYRLNITANTNVTVDGWISTE